MDPLGSEDRRVRDLRLVCALLGASFFLPAWGYLLAPGSAVAQFETLGRALGGPPYPWAAGETGWLWRVLAAGNVMTLALLCFLPAWSPRRFSLLLVPFLFMKGFASLSYLGVWLITAYPAFLAVSVWDALNCGLVALLWRRARPSL